MAFLFVHSITEDKLIKSLELGGFPLPSIAVIKPDTKFNDFGNITFIIKPEVLDPKDKKNVFYDRDIFSQRIPEIEYIVDKKKLSKIIDDIQIKSTGFETFFGFNDVESMQRKSSNYIQERFELSMILKKEFFLDNNKDYLIPVKKRKFNSTLSNNETFSNFIKNNDLSVNEEFKLVIINALKEIEDNYNSRLGNEIAKSIVEDIKNSIFLNDSYDFRDNEHTIKYSKVFNSFKKDKEILNGNTEETDIEKLRNDINDYIYKDTKNFKNFLNIKYTSQFFSNPHFKIGNKKYDYNLENIEKIMKKQDLIGVENVSDTSIGKISASFARKLSSFQDIEDNLYLLKDKEDRFITKDILNNKIFDIANNLSDAHTSKRFFDIQESLCIAITKGNTKENLIKSLSENGFSVDKINDNTLNECISIVKDLSNLDNHYFEGKPQKTIYIEDCAAVILPIGTDKGIINQLKDKVQIHFYDKENIESKIEIFDKYKFNPSKTNEKKIKKSLTI